MSSDSSLTVAALKELCKEKELSTAGRKMDLVNRLLKYGAEREELGLQPLVEEDEEEEPEEYLEEDTSEKEIITDDEGELLLEESSEEEEAVPEEIIQAEILEADILEADIIDDAEDEQPIVEAVSSIRKSDSPDIGEWKRHGALVLCVLLLAGGAWYWFSATVEPFTPDPLRHGDEMGFAVTGGEMVATGEYASKVFEWFGSDDDVCRLDVDFSGSGSISIAEGDKTDLSGEMTDDRLGAVKQRGGAGFPWLTMEKTLKYDFDDVDIAKSEQLKIGCQDMPSVSARVGMDWTEWVELSGENTLRSEFDYSLIHPDGRLDGEIVTFGLSGIIDSLETLGMGASMTFAPLQIHDILGNTLIEDGAAGNISGWSWRVTGSEEFGDEIAWKVLFQNRDLEEHCLGHATVHVLLLQDSPWAVRQTTDLLITGDDSGDCGTLEEILGEYAMPEGRLELRMTIEKTSLSRGEHLVDLGLSYDSKPDFSALRPPSSEMHDWGGEANHLPDNSTTREHTLEMAVSCIDHLSRQDVGAAADALQQYEGYIWRAQDNRSRDGITGWNLSWLANDDSSGWVQLDVSGTTPSSDNCTFVERGMHEEAPDHNRDAIPETASLSWMETSRWLDKDLFPELSGQTGLAAQNGVWRDDLRIGVLVATTGIDLPGSLDFLPINDAGKATVDGIRTWDDEGTSHTFTFAADATDGQILGWSHVWSSD